MKKLLVAIVFVAQGLSPAYAQTSIKKPITHDVYDSWKSIQGTKLSGDGVWLAYALTPQDGDGELVVRNLKTNAEIRAARGSRRSSSGCGRRARRRRPAASARTRATRRQPTVSSPGSTSTNRRRRG